MATITDDWYTLFLMIIYPEKDDFHVLMEKVISTGDIQFPCYRSDLQTNILSLAGTFAESIGFKEGEISRPLKRKERIVCGEANSRYYFTACISSRKLTSEELSGNETGEKEILYIPLTSLLKKNLNKNSLQLWSPLEEAISKLDSQSFLIKLLDIHPSKSQSPVTTKAWSANVKTLGADTRMLGATNSISKVEKKEVVTASKNIYDLLDE